MTTIAFFRYPDRKLAGFEASGHTGYAESGQDIVCSAVSALTESTLNGLVSVIGAPVVSERDDENARLTAMLDENATESQIDLSQILLRTLSEACQAIANEYPRNIRIIFKERRKYTCSK